MIWSLPDANSSVCANSGVDLSNVADGWAVLLPEDPDRSARRLRRRHPGADRRRGRRHQSDTFGRAWRMGVTDVALGCAGIRAVLDLRGTTERSSPGARLDRGLCRRRGGLGRRPRHSAVGKGGVSLRAIVRGVDAKSSWARGPSPTKWSGPMVKICSGEARECRASARSAREDPSGGLRWKDSEWHSMSFLWRARPPGVGPSVRAWPASCGP